MARSGDIVEHPVTGERITFLQTSAETDGEYATFELRVRPHGFVVAPHVHPHAEESFEIRSGTFTFAVDGRERKVGPGEGATVPASAAHAWWNAGEEEGVAIVEFRPGTKTEEFFESFFGLAQDGKVNPKTGLPNLLWLASIFRTYHDFGYIARPPLFVQRAIFTPLAAVARLLGYGVPYPYPYPRQGETESRRLGAGFRRAIALWGRTIIPFFRAASEEEAEWRMRKRYPEAGALLVRQEESWRQVLSRWGPIE